MNVVFGRIFRIVRFCCLFYCVWGNPRAQPGPPQETDKTCRPDLVDLESLDAGIRTDIRYAGSNNFLGRPVYPEPAAFLQRPSAEALLRVHKSLTQKGYGLLILDAYRPWSITRIFWEVTPVEKRAFVADPAKGSKHNRGCAIDLTLYRLQDKEEVPMPSGFDEMSERAHPRYQGGSRAARKARDLLRKAMEREGFSVQPNEWWHFNHHTCGCYPLLDISFKDIRKQKPSEKKR